MKRASCRPPALIAKLAALLALFSIPAHAADYNFVVEPTYSQQQAEEVYAPLIAYLSQATGHNFKLVTVRNYHVYWSEMRKREDWDFIFDDAHFTDYRVQRFNYTPLVRRAEPSVYSLLSLGEEDDETAGSFIGRSVVTMPSPSLGYLLLFDFYPNPMQQPNVVTSAQNWRDTVEIVFGGEADAAMVPEFIRNLYPNLLPVADSRQFPASAISASSAVPAEVRQQVVDALIKMHEEQELYEVLAELGITQFVPTEASEYAGSESILRNTFGY